MCELKDFAGPTRTDYFEGLLVSHETIDGGNKINDLRKLSNL